MGNRVVHLPCPCGKIHRARHPGRAAVITCPKSGAKLVYAEAAPGDAPVLRLCGGPGQEPPSSAADGALDHHLEAGATELGRTADPGIRLDDPGLSRRHCAFHRDGVACAVEDLHSRNGVHVNETRIPPAERVPLQAGDLVRAGGTCFRVLLPAAALAEAEAEEVDPLVGQTVGEFRVTGVLAEGGMGRVYTAERDRDGLACVVKTILPDAAVSEKLVERFRRELEMAAILDHPNIILPLGGGEHNGLLYLAMEYFNGVDLRKRFRRKPAPLNGVLLIAKQAVSALAHAHEQQIVHRDIKPDNILADRRGGTKILDFGIAKLLDDDELGEGLTMSRSTLGTPGYMAPEQMSNPKGVDGRADIYALGCTLFYCLAGRSPFPGKTPIQVMRRARMGPPDLVALREETPAPLADLVRRCMAPHPDARPAAATDLLAELNAITL